MNKNSADRHRQILEVATRRFSQNGYKKVTLKQIAADCGVTDAALYRHFSSKDAIYSEVLESVRHRLADQQVLDKIAENQTVEGILKGLAEHILEFFGENGDIYRLMLYSALEGHEHAKKVFEMVRGRYIQYLVEQLDLLYEKGDVVAKNNEITARCFIGMVFDCALGYSLWKGMQGRIYEASQVIANNIPIYVYGLKNR